MNGRQLALFVLVGALMGLGTSAFLVEERSYSTELSLPIESGEASTKLALLWADRLEVASGARATPGERSIILMTRVPASVTPEMIESTWLDSRKEFIEAVSKRSEYIEGVRQDCAEFGGCIVVFNSNELEQSFIAANMSLEIPVSIEPSLSWEPLGQPQSNFLVMVFAIFAGGVFGMVLAVVKNHLSRLLRQRLFDESQSVS